MGEDLEGGPGGSGSEGASAASSEAADAVRQLDLFFELSGDLLTIAGSDGRFRRLNPAWEKALGYSLAELYAMSWSELVHPDDQQRTIDTFRGADQSATMLFENRYRRRDGTYRWLEWNTIRARAEGVFYAVARDVTERKLAEERLRASDAYKTALHEAATDGIVAFDGEGRIIDFNPAAERMLGYRAERVLARSLVDFAIPPEGREAFLENLARFRKSESGIVDLRVEQTGLRADGSRFPLELTVTRLATPTPIFAAFIRDLTGAKRAESERRSLEDQLRQAQKLEAVGRLAGSVARDFNELLGAVTGFADFAGSALSTGSPGRERLDKMKKATQRAVTLVDQLLAFGRRQSLSTIILDVNGVILDLERMLRGLMGDDIEFQLALDPGAARVKADPTQLQQVLVNLAVNARDAMESGGRLRISTSNVELGPSRIPPGLDAQPGSYVCLSVEDNGAGMTDAVAAHVFEPFFTTKNGTGASGLGLSTVYGIVAQSGGFVRFETAPRRGTIFHVHLPRAADEHQPVGPERAVRAQAETVLLVEDEEAVRQLVRRILEDRGYTVILARHGGEALEVCHQMEVPIHLMLTDAVMPVLSGPELLRRAIALRPNMKLAIMSGYTDKPAVTGVPFIAKPFTPAELGRRVREILDAPVEQRHK
jgi:two-component system cell cycle sensor histidine kinase/response regulator CckA